MATPDLTNPAQNNIFAYGGNTIDARTGAVSGSVTPTISTINGNLLQPTPQINYATPNPTPVPDVSSLYATPAATLTDPEKQASQYGMRLQELNNQLLGRSADTNASYKQAGITLDANGNPTDAALSDLYGQLNQLTAQAQSIPIQFQNDAIGRGQTAAGVQPLQTAALRTNAINALNVNALISARQNKLSFSKSLIDQAIKAKYDPIQEQIDTATKNLQLIINSPEYSLADKNRAQQQLDAQKQKADQLAKQKEDSKTIASWAAAAIANGASTLQAQKIMDIANSDKPDLNAAFQVYAPFAKDPNAMQKALLDLQYQRGQITAQQYDNALKQAQINKTNAETAKTMADAASTGATPGSDYKTDTGKRVIDSVDSLITDAQKNPGIFGATAALPIPDFMRTSAFRNFKAQLETLKSNIAFGALTAMREASKTGGALGQISDREESLLSSTLGALDMSQDPAVFVQQLNKIKASVQRWNDALAQYGGTTSKTADSSDASGYPEGTTATGDDGKTYVVTGGKWVPR